MCNMLGWTAYVSGSATYKRQLEAKDLDLTTLPQRLRQEFKHKINMARTEFRQPDSVVVLWVPFYFWILLRVC